MNRTLAFISCLVLALAVSGCEQQNTSKPKLVGKALWEAETVHQTEPFPEFLAGVWLADRFEWGFKFEPDGSILKMDHMVAGEVNVEEKGVYMEGPDEGTFAAFVMGSCETRYNSQNRYLSVKTVLEKFHMRLPSGDLEGWEEDYFDGPVSEDGKTWTVDWRSYSWLEDAAPLDTELVDKYPEKLIFTKIDPNNLRKEVDSE